MQSPSSQKVGLKKGPWTPEEDQKLLSYIQQHGDGSWSSLPAKAGLHRCGKSCRLRWINYLKPDIKRGKFSLQEEQTIIQLHALLGNMWSAIAAHLPKRTDNEIKNYWNTQLKKRLSKMGIDPTTHKPKTDAHGSTISNPKDAANLSHMAQWERARLEAEARLMRETKQVSNPPRSPPQRVHDKNPGATKPPCLDILKAWQRVVSGLFSFNINNLESTTSTLPILSVGLNDSFVDAAELKESFDNSMGLNEILGYTPEDAWFQDMNMEESTMEFEGYLDTLMVCNSVDHQNQRSSSMEARGDFTAGTSYEGSVDENKNYWNSILNFGSPAF